MDGSSQSLVVKLFIIKCDEENYWYPDLGDVESKITANTRGIVIINPNNPTGSVYPRHVLSKLLL